MILAASFDLNNPTMWENRGLFYGDGIFETMRTLNQHIPLWDWHYQRLQKSLHWLKIKPPDSELLTDAIYKQLQSDKSLVLRLTLFRDQNKRGYQPLSDRCHWLVTASEFQQQDRPQRLVIGEYRLSPQPLLNGHKHLNRLPQVLVAEQLNHTAEVDDLLVLDDKQRVIETSRQNILLVIDDQLITPALHDCGVQGVAINWLQQHLPVITRSVSLHDLQTAAAVMTCNAVHGFRYVENIAGMDAFSTSQPICDKIAGMWRAQFLQSASL